MAKTSGTSKNIHEGHRERLREAARNDPELKSFSEYQLLEFFLMHLIPLKDTNPIAHELIETFGSLNGVFHATERELKSIPNMTTNAATMIVNFYPIMRKIEAITHAPKPYVSKPDIAVNVLRPYFIGRNEEYLYCLLTDINDRCLQIAMLDGGLPDSTGVPQIKISNMAARLGAKKIIIAHNHPGGTNYPSDDDIAMTRQLFLLLASLGIVLVDHIIFTYDNYYSFYEHAVLDNDIQSVYSQPVLASMSERRKAGYYYFEPLEKKVDTEDDDANPRY